jgi:hypothetical protein
MARRGHGSPRRRRRGHPVTILHFTRVLKGSHEAVGLGRVPWSQPLFMAPPFPPAPYYPRITGITQGYADDAITHDDRSNHIPY